MNKDLIKKEIRNLVEVITEQQEQVLSHEGKIPQIEMDILTGNIRKLYENLFELNKAEPSLIVSENVVTPEINNHNIEIVNETEEPATPAGSLEIPVEIPVEETHIQPEILIAAVDEPVVTEVAEVISEPVLPQVSIGKERAREFSRPSFKHASTASLFDDTPTVADKFHGTPTVIDKIAADKDARSLAQKLQKNPVTDLKKSIGINEKFSFINELFGGDLNAYNEAIDQLNSCANLSTAHETLNGDLSAKYSWSNDDESYRQLKNLIERRFSS